MAWPRRRRYYVAPTPPRVCPALPAEGPVPLKTDFGITWENGYNAKEGSATLMVCRSTSGALYIGRAHFLGWVWTPAVPVEGESR